MCVFFLYSLKYIYIFQLRSALFFFVFLWRGGCDIPHFIKHRQLPLPVASGKAFIFLFFVCYILTGNMRVQIQRAQAGSGSRHHTPHYNRRRSASTTERGRMPGPPAPQSTARNRRSEALARSSTPSGHLQHKEKTDRKPVQLLLCTSQRLI